MMNGDVDSIVILKVHQIICLPKVVCVLNIKMQPPPPKKKPLTQYRTEFTWFRLCKNRQN